MAKRVTKSEFKKLAESINTELDRRKKDKRRLQLDKDIKELDKQLAMTPPPRPKDAKLNWIPEFGLPLQAYALEVLTADVDRMLFPDSHEFFDVVCEMTDETMVRMEQDIEYGLKDPYDDDPTVPDDPQRWSQSDCDRLTESALIHTHKQYDLRKVMKQIAAEGIKYGTYIGKLRKVKRSSFTNDFRGVKANSDDLPILIPMSVKNTYLDDKCDKALHQGTMMGPLILTEYKQNVADIKAAAKKGGTNTQDMNGGWRKAVVNKLKAKNRDGDMELIEAEGDVLIKDTGKFFPNLIVTVAISDSGPEIIRIRENQLPFHSIMWGTYFDEGVGTYGTSPLIKGIPIQMAATEIFSNLLQVSALDAGPPVRWNPADARLRATGGPVIKPHALWDSTSDVATIKIGSMDDSLQAYGATVKQFEEVTGVSPLRAGGQTKSHQTATAITKEDQRGQTRTVAYVRSIARGFMTNLLNMELFILRKSMPKQSIYIPRYKGYVSYSKNSLPDNATFNVLGAAGPLEKKQRDENKLAALQALVQLEPVAQQAGGRPVDIDKIREAILEVAVPDSDTAAFFKDTPAPPMMPEGMPGQQMPAGPQQPQQLPPETMPPAEDLPMQ